MRIPPFVALASLVVGLGAQDDPAPAGPKPGPPIALTDAFPAQEKFDRPLLVEFHASDPSMAYVVSQAGTIFRVARTGKDAARAVFLEQKVFLEHFEEGLLGFAFDPAYAENGLVYVYRTEKTEMREGIMAAGKKVKSYRQSVISRFGTKKEAAGPIVDPATELRLMEIFQPFGNHNGGTIVFGPDKMLYIALGDGGSANDPFGNGQDKSVLLGKVLRIDVRGATKDKPYAIPADNPFVGEQGARGEIWTWGMRNPWRITFDRATGDLWCGDVGQEHIEEVDRLVKGGNYGWNFMEGDQKFEKRRQKDEPQGELLPPVAVYPHRDGLSVTGGYVYRGTRIPGLAGCFVYGDFNSFRMWAVKEDRKGGVHEVFELGRARGMISSFAEEPDGELLMTCFDGRIYRLEPKAAEPAKGN